VKPRNKPLTSEEKKMDVCENCKPATNSQAEEHVTPEGLSAYSERTLPEVPEHIKSAWRASLKRAGADVD
jgi:hypothetical protein